MKRWFWVLDVVVVVSFVVIGRDTHGTGTDWVETLSVALPFLLALGVGLFVASVWLDPLNWLVGLGLAAVTVIGGLLVRKYAFGDGTATTFVILTTVWMTAWMVGWRLVISLITRIVAKRRASIAA